VIHTVHLSLPGDQRNARTAERAALKATHALHATGFQRLCRPTRLLI